jgi:hypothetical protein
MESMVRLMVRCVDNRPYLSEGPDGNLYLEPGEGEMFSVSLGKVYEVIWEDEDFYRIVDNTGEPYMYPKYMFEPIN